ncbi:MAG: V-type ATP synthase subunit K [Spirochaetaceae bacterium]|jgi:V/A-type H+-transporting ATPase subunit K|nr:V-type ATP synthase subunit K [Spirochaetaceae bacterium]
MDASVVSGLVGEIGIGACLGLSAIGSAAGAGAAGMAAIGAWKKCFLQNKPAPFILVAFAGAPLTQTIYGFILMQTLAGAAVAGTLTGFQLLGIGIFAGGAMGASAFAQGNCAASASDAYSQTGQGFGNYMLVIGLCETVALFVMVFSMLIAG